MAFSSSATMIQPGTWSYMTPSLTCQPVDSSWGSSKHSIQPLLLWKMIMFTSKKDEEKAGGNWEDKIQQSLSAEALSSPDVKSCVRNTEQTTVKDTRERKEKVRRENQTGHKSWRNISILNYLEIQEKRINSQVLNNQSNWNYIQSRIYLLHKMK